MRRSRTQTVAPSEAYLEFAYAYDRALGKRFFDSFVSILDSLIEKYGPGDGSHLDIACGTGLVLEHMNKKGFRSTGLDASLPMLGVAASRAGMLVAADYRQFAFQRGFDRITCFYDSFNHLLKTDDLIRAFVSVSAALTEKGLFFFDMNHPHAYSAVWALIDPYESRARDHYLSIATRFDEDEKIGYAKITGWSGREGRKIKINESHRQRAYDEDEIRKALKTARLEIVEIVRFDPFSEQTVSDEPIKLLFVVQQETPNHGPSTDW